MKPLCAISLTALLMQAAPGLAETCVSGTFDRPLPGATNVAVRQVDVPASRFPGIWQEGRIDGYFYRIWSNEEAILQPSATSAEWTIEVVCDGDDGACRRKIEGTPSADAADTVTVLEQCLSDASYAGRTVPPPANPQPAAPGGQDITSSGLPSPEDTAIQPPADLPPCGLAALPDGPAGLTLQRLLTLAGGDPGPLDGQIGPRTNGALDAILGADARQLSQTEAIAALDRLLCDETQ